MAAPVDLYFDFISPFAYFAWRNLAQLEREGRLSIDPKPILFGALLSYHGHLGPAEIPEKRIYTFKTVNRYAAKRKMQMNWPKSHPFNPLLALRLATKAVAGAQQALVINCIFEAIWAEGIEGASPEELSAALDKAGLNAKKLMEKAAQNEAKEELKQNFAEGLQAGAFGVPTMIAGEELFWGNDGIEDLLNYIDDKDPLDKEHVQEVLSRPRGIDRKR